jgi:anti-sigma regulatory factor (Ser/Thr protein kinase)
LPPAEAESGRGLYIVTHLAREFDVARSPRGGAHARAALLARA